MSTTQVISNTNFYQRIKFINKYLWMTPSSLPLWQHLHRRPKDSSLITITSDIFSGVAGQLRRSIAILCLVILANSILEIQGSNQWWKICQRLKISMVYEILMVEETLKHKDLIKLNKFCREGMMYSLNHGSKYWLIPIRIS